VAAQSPGGARAIFGESFDRKNEREQAAVAQPPRQPAASHRTPQAEIYAVMALEDHRREDAHA
jgi:hypothetical protein